MKAFRARAAILLFILLVVAAPAKSEAASAAEIDAGVRRHFAFRGLRLFGTRASEGTTDGS